MYSGMWDGLEYIVYGIVVFIVIVAFSIGYWVGC